MGVRSWESDVSTRSDLQPVLSDPPRYPTYKNLRAPEKGISFFWGGGCQKHGILHFPSKSTFYPINKIQKVAHKVRATRDIIFRQGSEPIRPYKSPPQTGKSCQMPPCPMIPPYHWYHGTPVPCHHVYHGYHWHHAYHATMVP